MVDNCWGRVSIANSRSFIPTWPKELKNQSLFYNSIEAALG